MHACGTWLHPMQAFSTMRKAGLHEGKRSLELRRRGTPCQTVGWHAKERAGMLSHAKLWRRKDWGKVFALAFA